MFIYETICIYFSLFQTCTSSTKKKKTKTNTHRTKYLSSQFYVWKKFATKFLPINVLLYVYIAQICRLKIVHLMQFSKFQGSNRSVTYSLIWGVKCFSRQPSANHRPPTIDHRRLTLIAETLSIYKSLAILCFESFPKVKRHNLPYFNNCKTFTHKFWALAITTRVS